MKINNVRRILKERFEDFVESIDDEQLRHEVRKNTFVTGGAIVSLLLNEPINDLDIYFTDINTAIDVSHYYIEKFKKTHDVGISVFKGIYKRQDDEGIHIEIDYNYGIVTENHFPFTGNEKQYRPVAFSQNAITIKKSDTKHHVPSRTVQLILRFIGSPEEIHTNFDFIHCTNIYIPYEDKLILNINASTSILTKELRYNGSKYPIASVIRTRKYINRGWSINAGQYLKMAFQINELDLKNINVLRDQLVGIDAMYFLIFIEKLQNKDIKGMDMTQLCSLIDEIFDSIENVHDGDADDEI